ncbi:two-component sensor histidine kinase [Vagococcus penaei]|uniref:sensor histidine kinase n=1 Tax=Vagococcus penaei TaxID=633807 RepID=UPI000F8683BA|nr:HAMP domain-containing sensor histidine kinase [Vagococcus penaei]RSU01140.1 two-component sensor histidine kinase [Vagococcus penaei]
MRYLIQQMIAFFVIILLVLIVFGVSFTQFTRTTVKESAYEQLKGYSETVLSNIQTFDWTLGESLSTTQTILRHQNVGFYVLDDEMKVTYPEEKKERISKDVISKQELTELKDGQPLTKLINDKDLSGKHMTMAVYMQPLFSTNFKFEGILLVYQPGSNIDKGVSSLTQNLFKGFILSTIIAVIISYIFAKFQVNRINRMRNATKEIAAGNFDVHLNVRNKDELDDLAEDFNRMAVALEESHQEIERQEERRRNFMADVAHEMRTPLTTINGLIEGLSYNAIPENQKEKCLTLMQNETRRLIRLVNENLDYEKILTNQINIAIQKIDATAVLETIIDQLSSKASDKGDKLILETNIPIELYADYDRFVQIMVNIITNAIQFTENGQIKIKVFRGYLESTVEISDNGMGMSEEQQKNIWDRYYKADPSRKNTKYGESGLGLSIVDQLVRLHDGRIEVDSELGEGTTFSITFPDHLDDVDTGMTDKTI